MKNIIKASFTAVFLLLAAAHSGAIAQPAMTKEEYDLLKHNKIVLKETNPHYLKKYSNTPWAAVAYFRLSPAQFAGVIMDFHQYTKIFPKVKDLAITPLGESRYRLGYTVKSGIFTFRYTVIMTYDGAADLIWWDLDPENPGDFSVYKGYWKFFRKKGMTMAIYSISPIANMPVPDFIQEEGSRNEMSQIVKQVKDWIRSQKPR